jgi:diphthine synthase
MLYLIGLGLDLKDISLKALEAIKKSSKVYLENYTTTFPYKIEDLEKIIEKKVILADRQKIENELNKLLTDATQSDIAILIYGDYLAATTHITILREAEKAKIKTETIHNNSIFNVISDTGLQLYKFGKTTSLPKWQDNYKPTSYMENIIKNLSINAHTLILIDPKMSLKQAIEQLEQSDKHDLFKDITLIVVSCLGTSKQKIIRGKLKSLQNKKISEPFSIIVPSDLNFSEQ